MANETENRKFAEDMLPQWPLDHAIEWIKSNLKPADVFDMDELREAVESDSDPEDVFMDSDLAKWAESNGYVKE